MSQLLISISEIPGLTSGARRALIGLISFRNKATGRCNPRVSTLCERLGGVSEATTRRWLRQLRLAGVIDVTRHRSANSYKIELSEEREKPGSEVLKSCARPVKSDRSRPVKSDRSRPVNSDRSRRRFLYEQTGIEQTEVNRGAAVPSEGLRKPARTAAAAIPTSALQQNSQTQNAAPEVARPVSQQLGLDLQPADPIRAQAVALVDELHAVHPQPGLPDKAVAEAEKILRASEDPAATLEKIRANHAAWKAHWEMLRPGQFIPQLWRWFRDGEWRRTVGKPVRHETWYERQRRETEGAAERLQPLFDQEMEEWRAKQRRFGNGH